MKKFALLALLAAGCASAQPADLTPEQKAMAATGNDFSFRFLQQIDRNEEKDWFVSPVSLQFLLSVVLNGAQNATSDEIARTLGFEAAQLADLNAYSRAILDRLPKLDPATKLTIGNAVFVNKMYPIEKKYQHLVEKYYDAEVRNLDFKSEKATLGAINGWCNKQTNGMIPKVLDEVTPDMLAYLLNALYFKSQWKEKFPKGNTSNEAFTLGNGSSKKVPMMKNSKEFM